MKVAQACKTRDPVRIAQARRELAEANITAAIQHSLAASPPLTYTQLRTLSRLLRGGTQ